MYGTYAKAVGYLWCAAVLFCFLTSTAFGIGTNLWLAEWSDANATSSEESSIEVRLGVYFALGITQGFINLSHHQMYLCNYCVLSGIFIFFAAILTAYTTVWASSSLHKNVLNTLLSAPMSFFDVTPMGAIINRVGKVIRSANHRTTC